VTDFRVRVLKTVIKQYPAVIPYLTGRARWMAMALKADEYKTYDFFLQNVERMIESVYNGFLGGEFIDLMANVISGQLTQAYQQAFADEGFTDFILPPYLQSSLESLILSQYDHVDGLYRDIVDARVDGTPIAPLLARAQLWAGRWTEAYNEAVRLIAVEMGGRLIWKLGATEKHCSSCSALNGIIAFASEWDELGVAPQGAPNSALECGGWKCDCSLSSTTQRRTPKAYDAIIAAVSR